MMKEKVGCRRIRIIFLARAGLPDIRPYDLRHTCATLLLLAGEDVKVVSERLGHSTTRLTHDTYQHFLPGMQARAAAKINAVLSVPRQQAATGAPVGGGQTGTYGLDRGRKTCMMLEKGEAGLCHRTFCRKQLWRMMDNNRSRLKRSIRTETLGSPVRSRLRPLTYGQSPWLTLRDPSTGSSAGIDRGDKQSNRGL
jgi:hypothetical protein